MKYRPASASLFHLLRFMFYCSLGAEEVNAVISLATVNEALFFC